jgi:hypothetical protein
VARGEGDAVDFGVRVQVRGHGLCDRTRPAVFEGGGIEVVQVKQVRKRDEVRAQCCDRLAAARSRNL